MQVITADMFITQPASLVSCAATELLNGIIDHLYALEMLQSIEEAAEES